MPYDHERMRAFISYGAKKSRDPPLSSCLRRPPSRSRTQAEISSYTYCEVTLSDKAKPLHYPAALVPDNKMIFLTSAHFPEIRSIK